MPDDGLTGRSILVVDDEDFFLRSVVEGIGAELPGVELFTANDGAQALAVLERQVIDLVVTDVAMPVMDGMEFVAAMVSAGMRIPVIMVTAFGNRNVELEARRHGVISVIDKPIDFAFLVEICRNTLRSLGHGNLGGVTLAGLLQLLEMESRSCTVRVFSAGRSGRIFIEQGKVVGSLQDDEMGMEAMRIILSWPDPTIELGPLRTSERSVPMSLSAVLLDAARIEDENLRNGDFDLEEWAEDPFAEPIQNSPPSEATREQKDDEAMANIEQAINAAMNIQGCIAAALVDHESGMCLGSKANGFPIEVAAAGNTEVLRAKLRVKSELGLDGGIQDMLITLDTQFHLIVPLRQGSLVLYIAIDRKTGNLAMARHKLSSIESTLVV